ncbi:MAG: sigma-54-dependent Fis family transcriptional regulator [Spirochaetaceae bacterium]|nr:sigma-54-dependent Fis family transcriptional regulator [Spirochaetaceae bacterium]
MKYTILLIDDEKNIREGLKAVFEMDGYKVALAADGKEGLTRLAKGDIDLVITDLRMAEVSGEEVLQRCITDFPGLPVLILTGHGSIDNAVSAMQMGAYDFLTKPVNVDKLLLVVKRALQARKLQIEHLHLKEQLNRNAVFESIIGKTPAMEKLFQTLSKVSDSKASVLITGESGVGKELVAKAIHSLSPRKEKPLVIVNCAALSPTLLESELFGHEKGAFTGAVARKRGRFELANEGTIFLDEIGEIDPNVQVKILRVLQEKKFERVGGEDTLDVDVRIISATNRDLEKAVAEGKFREDLFYRLNVVNLYVPPLRERQDDIPILAAAFLEEFAKENNKTISSFDGEARRCLYSYDWPGNIRQLRNCIESAVVMCSGKVITADDLPPNVRMRKKDLDGIVIPYGISLENAEKIIIEKNLMAQKGNKSKTADILQIGRKTLHRKLAELKIEDE